MVDVATSTERSILLEYPPASVPLPDAQMLPGYLSSQKCHFHKISFMYIQREDGIKMSYSMVIVVSFRDFHISLEDSAQAERIHRKGR